MNETIEKIAGELSVTPAQLATDLWFVANWIDENRNRGFSLEQLRATGVELQTYMLVDSAFAVLDGIVFERFDGPKSRRYSEGWMVRKNPNWRVTWRTRFAEYAPDKVLLIDQWQAEQEAAKAAEESKPKRKVEGMHGEGYFESFTSLQIAYRAAVAHVLMRRYREMRWNRGYLDRGAWRYMAATWQQQWETMIGELRYRTEAEPEPRSSKKKTREAVEDFAKAKELVEAGTSYFFSPEYVEQVLSAVEEPDLTVDFEHLPRQPLEKTPVRWLSDRQVIESFLQFLAEDHDPASFEYEDQKLVLETLRKTYARAKGQKIDDKEIKIETNNPGGDE
jgi:hypothetical protein